MRWAVAIGTLLLVAAPLSRAAAQERSSTFRDNPAEFFGPDAYPVDALRNGEQGRVVARLAVDDHGRVVSCIVTGSSGSAALDQATCRIALDRIVFIPAADRRGRPIASTYTLPVRWVLPSPDAPLVLTEQLVETTMSVDADGEVVACNTRADPPLSAQAEPCTAYPVGRRSNITFMHGGRRVGGTVTRTYRVHVTLDP